MLPLASALVESPEPARTTRIARTTVALRNIGDLFEIVSVSASIQGSLPIGCPHRSFGQWLNLATHTCNRLPDIAAVGASLWSFDRTKMPPLGRQPGGAALPLSTLEIPPIRRRCASAFDPRKAKLQFN
jgi:hypothetical protein